MDEDGQQGRFPKGQMMDRVNHGGIHGARRHKTICLDKSPENQLREDGAVGGKDEGAARLEDQAEVRQRRISDGTRTESGQHLRLQ